MRTLLGWALMGFYACAPVTPLSCTPAQGVPVEPVVQFDSGCAVLDAITSDRMVRTDDGSPLVIHCDGGK